MKVREAAIRTKRTFTSTLSPCFEERCRGNLRMKKGKVLWGNPSFFLKQLSDGEVKKGCLKYKKSY